MTKVFQPTSLSQADQATVGYYSQNAAEFFASTVDVDMTPLYERFLKHLPARASILDAGCGSGRDARAFANRGFEVTAFDASPALAVLASKHCGFEVSVRQFSEVNEVDAYDGVWCCASLLHVPRLELPFQIEQLWQTLRPSGLFYASFKLGPGERLHNGRSFTDIDEVTLRLLFESLPCVDRVEIWITDDQRPDRAEQWVNVLAARAPMTKLKLITGGSDPFLPHLSHAIAQANEIDIAVAFVKVTGMRLLMPDLLEALGHSHNNEPVRCRIRILTSDYLDVTDPEALRLLLLLQERGAEIRIFSTLNGGSFHLKAYIFSSTSNDKSVKGTTFIGSSNITGQALQEGLEWNYRVCFPDDAGFFETRQRFDELFNNEKSVSLTNAWVVAYEKRRTQPLLPIAPGSNERESLPTPNRIQREALDALSRTRKVGYRRGLVVLATGLDKTWLAAFDAVAMQAKRVLFVAHREEILSQAGETFLRIRPNSRVGFYMGKNRDIEADILCASVQTLTNVHHLERFSPEHFDYIVVDEFHHAAASTYRRLLSHFAPSFLLGITATPERSDQSDILSLCDDNLIFTCDLFAGIEAKLLSPFHYFGILDESVNYTEIPWRNGRFDPEHLSMQLATYARANHALKEWENRAQQRTLAFCVSTRHADFMAEHFSRKGIASAAVYAGSNMGRAEALDGLKSGKLQIIFSVDLFNEGLDLPEIDTVMMLRPTESKILFLQQLGRGLRRSDNKEKLVVLDFIGNHHSFLHKPQALFQAGTTYKALARFARTAELGELVIPEGCLVNFHLGLIDFLKSLDSSGISTEYEALKASLGRRPTLTEFYRSGANLRNLRQQHGSWLRLVGEMGDLSEEETSVVSRHALFLREVEMTAMTKCFKMILLEALLELDGLEKVLPLGALCKRSWQVLDRRKAFLGDLPDQRFDTEDGDSPGWQAYWRNNPVKAWTGGNHASNDSAFFQVVDENFKFLQAKDVSNGPVLKNLTQEIIDYRLAAYEVRQALQTETPTASLVPSDGEENLVPYFPDLNLAVGHTHTGLANNIAQCSLPSRYGTLDAARHFIVQAPTSLITSDGKSIAKGDFLLMERIDTKGFNTPFNSVAAVEGENAQDDGYQIVLRVIGVGPLGTPVLNALDSAYSNVAVTEKMQARAQLISVVDRLDMAMGRSFMREEIPELFGEKFSPGNWNSGHVVFSDRKIHILLVTLNKQGKSDQHRYHDYWIDKHNFHWQSQNSTTPSSKKGQDIIEHVKREICIHLFVRETKLNAGKGAPFVYHGKVTYLSHTGSSPMSVIFRV